MSAIKERIATTSRALFLLLGLGGAGLHYMSSSEAISQKQTEIENERNVLSKNQEDVAAAKKIAGDKQKFEQDVNKVIDQLQAALEFLPTRLNEQDILSKISGEARSAGVNPTGITPRPPQMKTFYEELQMEVRMEGTYSQLVLFLSYISKIQRIVTIRGMDLSVKEFRDDVPVLTMKGTLVAYRYVEGK